MWDLSQEACQTCNSFQQHYIFWRGQFRRVGYGHCCYNQHTRQCRPERKACKNWSPQTETYKREHDPSGKV